MKPLAEVLAAVHYDALQEANKRRGLITNKWAHLTPEAQAAHLHAMHAVVDLVNGFGLGIRKTPSGFELHKLPAPREVKISPTSLGAPKVEEDSVSKAKTLGFTGIPCDQCGSLNTVRIGKCLQCQTCFHNGECG